MAMSDFVASLISVVKTNDHVYAPRQMPLVVEDKTTMVLQFPDKCTNCGLGSAKKTDIERFVAKYMSLNSSERISATTTSQSEIAEQLARLVPCVGCRKSVERMLSHLSLSGNATLDPMQVTSTRGKRCQITLKKSYMEDPKLLFAMFYIHGDKLGEFVTTMPRSKKNKRCQLHSLDTQKIKSTSNWTELWSMLTIECKEEMLIVEYSSLKEAMAVYLEKHRFCTECKNKVLHAYGLLKGDDGKNKDKSYCPAMYDGITYCKKSAHLRIRNEASFIEAVVSRAEPDLMGSRRERHAKTLDIAQEEVLTCLGSYLYTRFNRLLQKIKLEEQTWQQLFYMGICCLKQNFEVVLEQKQGISQLELLCSEIELEERNKEHKKEMKRKKKKKSKESKRNRELTPEFECDGCMANDMIGCAECISTVSGSSNSTTSIKSASMLESADCVSPHTPYICNSMQCDDQHTRSPSTTSQELELCECDFRDAVVQHSDAESEVNQSPVHIRRGNVAAICPVKTSTSDLGYSSGPESCDSCIGCSNGIETIPTIEATSCDRHATAGLDHSCDSASCGYGISGSTPPNSPNLEASSADSEYGPSPGQHQLEMSEATAQHSFHLSLQDMLESNDKVDSAEFITDKEVEAFKANMPKVTQERLELREKLKERFRTCMEKHRSCCSMVPEHCNC